MATLPFTGETVPPLRETKLVLDSRLKIYLNLTLLKLKYTLRTIYIINNPKFLVNFCNCISTTYPKFLVNLSRSVSVKYLEISHSYYLTSLKYISATDSQTHKIYES